MLAQNSVGLGSRRIGTQCLHDGRIFEKQKGEFCVSSDDNDWLTSEEAAAFLRISPATLRNLTSNGKVPFYKFGRSNRYRKSELRNMLLSTRKGT